MIEVFFAKLLQKFLSVQQKCFRVVFFCKARRGTYYFIDRMFVYSSNDEIEQRQEMTYL